VTLVDYSNAFNSTDHRCILKVLRELGVPDVDIIEDMLKGSIFWLTNNQGTTEVIPLNRGVKQGAIESPLIFCLFIDTLLRYLQDANVGIDLPGGGRACNAAFADATLLSPTT